GGGDSALRVCARAWRGSRGLGGGAVTPRRVALTGRGVVSPLGVGVAAHWDALCAGRSGVARLGRLAALGFPATRGGTVAPSLVEPHLGRLPRKQQKLYNRATLFAMLGAALAVEDAGLPRGASDPTRFGVVLGVSPLAWDLGAMTAYLVASESRQAPGTLDMVTANGFCMHNINPLDFSLKTLPNLAAGHVAIAHDAQGLCRAIAEGPIGGARAVGGDAPDMVGRHGDGIPAHDEAEAWALARVLGGRAERTPRLRMKRAHADLGAAASPVELLACSAALDHATLPPLVSENAPASASQSRRALVISLWLFGECSALMRGNAGGDDAR